MSQLNIGFERHTSFENVEKLSPGHMHILGLLKKHHKGKGGAIKSHDIARKLCFPVTNTNQKIRKVCKELLAAGYPIISCQSGFYFAQTYEELVEFSNHIQSRMNGLQRTWRDTRAIIADFAKKDGFR